MSKRGRRKRDVAAEAEKEPVQEAAPEHKETGTREKTENAAVKKNNQYLIYAVITGVIVIAAIGIFYLFNTLAPTPGQGTTGAVIAGNAVVSGDFVNVSYTGKLQNGEVFDEGVIAFTAGSDEMIKGFDEAVIGMTVGQEKTVTVPPEKGYGNPDPSMVLAYPLVRTFNKTDETDVQSFTATFGEDPVVGKTYKLESMYFPLKVITISEANVTVEYVPENGMVVESSLGNETITVSGEEVKITLAPNVGSTIMTPYGSAKITGVQGDSMMLDFNSELAGKTLVFTIKLLNFTKQSKLDQVCNQLGLPKADRPDVKVFVMSYCPYGLQIEKGVIPAKELLGDKIDVEIMFVNYIMHDKKEIDENTIEYCMQKEQPEKFWKYLKCFVGSGNSQECMSQEGIDKSKIDVCVAEADLAFNITGLYNDRSTWSNGMFPLYMVHNMENLQHGVRGSPTVVINGKQVSVYPRSPENVKNSICCAFNVPPEECSQTLGDANPSSGFGWSEDLNQGVSGEGCAG